MEFEKILLKPGVEVPKSTPLYKTLNSNISFIFSKMSKELKTLIYNQNYDFQYKELSIPKDNFPGGMVVSLCLKKGFYKTSLEYIKENIKDYLICLKSDGIRYLLALTSKGGCYMISRSMEFWEVFIDISNLSFEMDFQDEKIVYLFDGELILDVKNNRDLHFQVFDCVLFNNVLVVKDDYFKRLKFCEGFLGENDFFKNFEAGELVKKGKKKIKVFLKDFFETKDIRFLLKETGESSLYKEKIDGIIFTKIQYPYLFGKNYGIVKWKPDYLNSIDFLVLENHFFNKQKPELFQNDDFFVLELYVISKNDFALFDYLFIFDIEEYINIKKEFKNLKIFDKKFEGAFMECKYNKKLKKSKIDNFYKSFFDYDREKIEYLLKNSLLGKDNIYSKMLLNHLFKTLELRYDIVNKTYQGNWENLRIRKDKELPNGFITARNVFSSIFEDNISEDLLVNYLEG